MLQLEEPGVWLRNQRKISTASVNVIQWPVETFTDILQRLSSAIHGATLDPETRQLLMEILSLENKNTECNREIKSLEAQGAPIEK